MNNLKQKIINSVQDGSFLEVIYQAYFDIKKDPDENLGLMLANLHNSRQLNLIEEFSNLYRDNSKNDFFTLRHVFSDALPHLGAPVIEVMACVKHLTTQADGDMTQGLLIGPFMEYCKKTPTRIEEVLNNSLETIDEHFDFISPSLIAGSEVDFNRYFDIAIGLVANSEIRAEVLRRVIFSLGRIRYADTKDAFKAFSTILNRTDEVDSQSFSVCLKALFNIYVQDLSLDKEFLEFVSANSQRYDDQAIYTVSELLYFNNEAISDAVQELLLEIVAKVNPEHKGTIDNIDWVLVKLFEKGDAETAINCFDGICAHSGKEISIQKLDSFSRKLIDNPDQILSKTITKWFLSKSNALCRQTFELLQNHYFDKNIEIDCDLSQINNKDKFQHLYLARKAIGWFYMRPISAASFVISMIDGCPKNELDEIEEILFQPLLISYPGSVKDYLNVKVKYGSKKVRALCKRLLNRLDSYHAGLASTQSLKELKPSEQDRYAYNRHHQRLMNESMKSARSSSLLSVLGVHESVLLYGNKSISYIHTGPDQKFRQEIPLRQISTSVEFPSLQVLDPHNLDWQLRVFRVEGCQK